MFLCCWGRMGIRRIGGVEGKETEEGKRDGNEMWDERVSWSNENMVAGVIMDGLN